MNKDYERIQKIKEDRLLLLKQSRDNIINNKNKENQQLSDILKVLNYDEDSLKKIVSYFKAKELIASLVDDIVNANSVEEVIKIRSRLNYYISKIKEELKYRNIGPVTKDSYNDRLTSMRDDISKYIRYLRRSNNLLEIDSLYSRYDNLNKEEMKRLKYLLKLEQNYNHRNLVVPSDISKEEKLIETNNNEEITNSNDDVDNTDNIDKKESFKIEFPLASKNHVVIPTNLHHVDFNEVEDFFKGKVDLYQRQYGVVNTHEYGEKHKFITLLRNLPRFHSNKKAINEMQASYIYFCRNNDLAGYVEYLRRRNSIKNNLKYIFSGSKLYSEEQEDLFKHEQCAKWIYDYCKRHDMGVVLDKTYVK